MVDHIEDLTTEMLRRVHAKLDNIQAEMRLHDRRWIMGVSSIDEGRTRAVGQWLNKARHDLRFAHDLYTHPKLGEALVPFGPLVAGRGVGLERLMERSDLPR